jgi:hypothetical protein
LTVFLHPQTLVILSERSESKDPERLNTATAARTILPHGLYQSDLTDERPNSRILPARSTGKTLSPRA